MNRLFFSIAILFFYPCFSQEQGPVIQLDSVDKVIVIDHQNFNYEWYCGRTYDIVRINGEFEMRRVKQYSLPYLFGQPEHAVEKTLSILAI